jgi:hypothetical protein
LNLEEKPDLTMMELIDHFTNISDLINMKSKMFSDPEAVKEVFEKENVKNSKILIEVSRGSILSSFMIDLYKKYDKANFP